MMIRGAHGVALRTRVRTVFTTITILGALAFIAAAGTGVVELYQLALILTLAMPAGTFVYVVIWINR